jgi:hypothetical protein
MARKGFLTMTRRGWGALLLSLAAGAANLAAQEQTAPPFTFDKPVFMAGPEVSKSLMGSTYAYTARASGRDTRLLITLMRVDEVRARFAEMSDIECINLFLEEIRTSHQRFFVVNVARPLGVGPAEFPRFRWTGDRSDKTMTGVLSCGHLDGHYYVVHFVDELRAATRSFPAIRASLKTLLPRGD